MERIDTVVAKELNKRLGRKPKLKDYKRTEVRKILNEEGVSIFYRGKVLNKVNLKK